MASQYFSPAIDLVPPRKPGKRKAQSDQDDSEHESRARAGSSASDDEAEEAQSGDDDLALPVGFPAAPLSRTFGVLGTNKRASKRQRNLKQQHVAALNAVLHKSLLSGDYARASQAFGLLLRLEVNKQHVDLRKKALWGIGAEILLHKHDTASASNESISPTSNAAFSEAGFAATKAYFERLILQYPLRKQRPNDTNELTFYPAMLGLWIFQINARYHTSGPQSDGLDTDDDLPGDEQEHDGTRLTAAQHLKDAQEMADRIESLTHFPPFDRHVPTLKLQIDVLNWLADLRIKSEGDEKLVKELRERAKRVKLHLTSMSQTSLRA